jgi:hypothetical protein
VAVLQYFWLEYETLGDLAQALVKEYEINGGVRCVEKEKVNAPNVDWRRMLMGFSQ